MDGQRYFWKDIESGHITVTTVNRCPPGHVASDGAVRDGKVVRTSFHMMDGAPLDHADGAREVRDGDGDVGLLDHAAGSKAMSDALGACASTCHDLQHKVSRHIIDAKSALSDAAFDNAIMGLQGMARQYVTRSHLTADAVQKAAMHRAGQAVSGYVDGLRAARAPKALKDEGGGYAGHKRRLADAWRHA